MWLLEDAIFRVQVVRNSGLSYDSSAATRSLNSVDALSVFTEIQEVSKAATEMAGRRGDRAI